jgi:Fur family peroxide stress response transcriptional regulator
MMVVPASRLSVVIEKLKKQGYRITPQRIAILKIFTESEDHPSVEQVYERVKIDFPMTSLATVYKTVLLLKEEGEVLELGFANGSSRYDGNKPYPHAHLICVKCQKIVDPEIELFNELPRELAQKYGFQIVNQRVDFYGVCPQCQMKTAV